METFKEFLIDFFKISKSKFMVNLIYNFLSGITSGINIVMLIPLLSIIGLGENTSKDTFYINFINGFFPKLGKDEKLIMVLIAYMILIFFQAAVSRKTAILNVEIVQGYAKVLRKSLYNKLLNAEWSYSSKKKASDIINHITVEVGRVSFGVISFQKMLSQGILSAVQLYIAFLLSRELTLFVLLCGTLIFFFMRSTFKESKKLGVFIQNINRELMGKISNHLSGIKEIKSYGVEDEEIEEFNKIVEASEENMVKFVKVQSKPEYYYKVLAGIIISIFFYFAIKVIQVNPEKLLVVIIIFSRLWPMFSAFQNNLQNIFVMLPSFKEIKSLEKDLEKNVGRWELSCNNVGTLKFEEYIQLKNISFKYFEREDSFALKNLNLKIDKNSLVSIIGKSGAGKSTIVDLILGLISPSQGYIELDGKPLLEEDKRQWKSKISYVPQDPFLFNGTIRDNLIRFNSNKSDEEIIKALELSMIKDFIETLPRGLDTVIGDRGISLSGGEKQRIILARALLRSPEVLILDEATSALDIENENKIQKTIEKLKGSMTIILISHKLSTVKNADKIIVIEEGNIIEEGSYKELLNNKDGYLTANLKVV